MSHNPTLSYDPLLECLVIFSRLYHRPTSIESLIAGLPIEPGEHSPELFSLDNPKALFSRVAKRAGFASRLIKSDLTDISELLLPCILVLKGRKACILDQVDHDSGMAKVIYPEIDDGEEWVELDKLNEQYLGYAFLLKKQYHYQSRSLKLLNKRQGHWFWGTIWRSRHIYASVILASLMVNLFVLATPLFTMNVYDRVVPNNATETLWVLAIGVAIVYLFDTVLRFVRTNLLEIAGKKSNVIISSIIFEHTLNLRMDQWPASVGAFANTLREFESIRNFLTSATLAALIDIPFAIIFLLVIFYVGHFLVAVPIIGIFLLLLYSYFMVKPLKQSIESTYEASSRKHSLLVENLSIIQTIKSLGTHNHAQWEWEEASGEIAEKSLRAHQLSSSISVVTNLIAQLTTVALVIGGVYMVKDQSLSLGGLIAIMILASRTIGPMGQVASLIASYEQTKTAYNSLDELMTKPVERPEGKAFVHRPEFNGAIQFKQASFSYPETERNALNNININISPGEHIGIIGRVGSGKSTVGRLLVNLYQPTEGSLLIDGLDIKQINPADLRSHIAFVSQDIDLLRGTVRENILYKDPHADDETLLRASQLGAVDQFIDRHPLGYDMPVGEQGVGLSGGQRQSIAIARAMLKDVPIVILDEPTSSMDNTTEALIRERLQHYLKNKTLLLITHKPSMLQLVDRLIVLDQGNVVMDGPKETVLSKLQGETNA